MKCDVIFGSPFNDMSLIHRTHIDNKSRLLPHSVGNGVLGDLLSVNSVPEINPIPLICKKIKPVDTQRY